MALSGLVNIKLWMQAIRHAKEHLKAKRHAYKESSSVSLIARWQSGVRRKLTFTAGCLAILVTKKSTCLEQGFLMSDVCYKIYAYRQVDTHAHQHHRWICYYVSAALSSSIFIFRQVLTLTKLILQGSTSPPAHLPLLFAWWQLHL